MRLAKSYVADFENHRVQKFTAGGDFLVAFWSRGPEEGAFVRPTDVAVDEAGNVFVVDYGNDRIQYFAPQ